MRGFTLVELLVTVAIIGILTAIALPAYQDSVRKSARSEAKVALLDILQAQENYFINESTYTANLTHVNFANPYITATERYSITAGTCLDGSTIESCVSLTATPQKGQTGDGTFIINSRGERKFNGAPGWPR